MPRKCRSKKSTSHFGDGSVPILLATRSLQQLVGTLAAHGTLRLADAADAVGVRDLNIVEGLRTSRVFLFSIPGRERFIALNPQLPGAAELGALVRFLEPATGWVPRFCAKEAVILKEPPQHWEQALFGHRVRLDTLLAIEALGGRASAAQVGTVIGLRSGRTAAILKRIKRRGIVRDERTGDDSLWSFTDASWTPLLRSYLSAILKTQNEIVERAAITPHSTKRVAQGRAGRLRYKNTTLRTAEKPLGYSIPDNRAPLLFTTDARRRVLEVIALKGAANGSEIAALAETNPTRMLQYFQSMGVIEKRTGAGRSQIYSLSTTLPGRDHLAALLAATSRKYSPRLSQLDAVTTAPAAGKWSGNIETVFGNESRGLALIGARATGGVDASTLRKLNPDVERVQVRRALHLFQALEVLTTRREGNAILYLLNPDWFAYAPLVAFIDALIAASARHQHWRTIVPMLQLPKRRAMSKNARRQNLRLAQTA